MFVTVNKLGAVRKTEQIEAVPLRDSRYREPDDLAANLNRETPKMPKKSEIERHGQSDPLLGGFLGVMRSQREAQS